LFFFFPSQEIDEVKQLEDLKHSLGKFLCVCLYTTAQLVVYCRHDYCVTCNISLFFFY